MQYNSGEFDTLRLIVDDEARATAALRRARVPFRTAEVLLVNVPDRPGELLRVGKALGASGVNIEAFYNVAGGSAGTVATAFRVSDVPGAKKALGL